MDLNEYPNMIDSRDIIDRIEELEAIQEELNVLYHDGAIGEMEMLLFDNTEGRELDTLRDLVSQCKEVGDWQYGTTLIKKSYFVTYIQELIYDMYFPSREGTDEWPYRHLKWDFDAAAEEAKMDYKEVDYNGQTYFLRS